jgi:phospholipid/cholesterol/gamma-HCH transport system substrate-binding protein
MNVGLSSEARVGAVTLAALILLAGMIFGLNHFTIGDKGYPVTALFHDVSGLTPGNLVRFAGVEVGRVEAVAIVPEGIKVSLRIRKGTAIPVGSHFTIGTDGLLGEKFISIVPPANGTADIILPGASVVGEDPQGIANLISSADQVLADVHALVQSLNDILGDDNVKAALKDSALNAKLITDNLNILSASLARMATNNEQDVSLMVSNLKAMSESLKTVTNRMDHMLASVDNNGQTAADLTAAIHNVKITSERIETIAKSLQGIATDPKTAQNITETLQNAREASDKANKMLSKVANIRSSTSLDILYNPNSGKYRSDASVKINTSPQDFAVLGVDNFGESSTLNLQIGKEDNGFAQRVGLVSGKAGLGLDKQLGDQLRFSVDVYDPNDVKVKLRTEYKLSDNTSLVGQTDSINKQSDKNTYFGISRAF